MGNRFTSVQKQEQKTVADMPQGYRPSRYGEYLISIVLMVGSTIFIWWVSNLLVHLILCSLGVLATVLVTSWFAHRGYHTVAMMHYERKEHERDLHFYTVSDFFVMGDSSTSSWISFYATTPLEEPKQEVDDGNPLANESWQEIQDRNIYNYKTLDGKSWNEIAEIVHSTVSKCRTSHDRHQSRLLKGETFDGRL